MLLLFSTVLQALKAWFNPANFEEAPPTWYVETGEAAMKGVIDVCAIIRLVEMLYGEE